jgi:hypothetical protein
MSETRLYRCELDSRHYVFEGYGVTPEDAREALKRAIIAHTATYGGGGTFRRDCLREIDEPDPPYFAQEVRAGYGYRDREPISKPKRVRS